MRIATGVNNKMKTMHLTGVGILALIAGSALHSPVVESLPARSASDLADTAAGDAARALGNAVSRSLADVAHAPEALAGRYFNRDLAAMQLYRPGYRFWHHVFTVPNGRMAFGSAADGALLATFPLRGDWEEEADWVDSSLAAIVMDAAADVRPPERRDAMAAQLTDAAGPVVYHETRGSFIADGTARYGSFLAEWGAIFERFGVPAEIGLAQALVESGLQGRIRSEAEAIGFCQWMPRNWNRLKQLSPYVIEGYNQTTQAPYCAAHLAILATKYGSLIPALSEHHAGGTNVGRSILNGEFAGGEDVRDRYFLGAELTLLVRQGRLPGYQEVAGSYGPRSFRYAEMVFGNAATIAELEATLRQERIFAMRASRDLSLDELTDRTGLSVDELRRFNPALVSQVPAEANLYLPFRAEEFGPDTAFWHYAPAPDYVAVLSDFTRLDERFDAEDWHDGAIFADLREFESRFRATDTEEGTVMAVMIAYMLDELSDGRQRQILTDVQTSESARLVRERGVQQREALLELVSARGGGWAVRNTLLTTTRIELQ